MRGVVTGFGGQAPRLTPFALPDQLAQKATNTKLASGAVHGIHQLTLVKDFVDTSIVKAFRIPSTPNDTWMGFQSLDAVVARTPVTNDSFERFYWHEPGGRILYNTKARIIAGNTGGDAPYWLGVPQPVATPAVSPTGGSGTTVTRSYVYTFVSAFGEEGPPSNPSPATNGFDNGTWNLSGLDAAPADAANRNITKVRIYRTVTSITSNADFYFVAEINVGTTTYADTQTDLTVASVGRNLTSTFWFPPPAPLDGFCEFPNGVFLAWKDSTIYMSVPYRPHAWNPTWAVSAKYPIVGIGVSGNTAVVATTGPPSALTMNTPDNASFTEIQATEPCKSRGSIIGSPEGVYYASQNGLMFFGPSGFDNITREILTKDEWLRDYNPASLRACRYEMSYIGITTPGLGYIFTGTDQRQGFVELNDLLGASNIQNDVWTGEVYLLSAGRVLKWDDITQPEFLWRWASKRWKMPYAINVGAVRIACQPQHYASLPVKPAEASFGEVFTPPVGNTGAPNTVTGPPPDWAAFTLRVYANGGLVLQRYVNSSDTIRLPSGFKSDDWQFEILGRRPMEKFEWAETEKELAQV